MKQITSQMNLPFTDEITLRKKMKAYLSAKRYTSKRRGIEFALTLDDIDTLLKEAGITAHDIGQQADDYCLARNGDRGGYTLGNCRFITQYENYNEAWGNLTPEEQEEWRIRGARDGSKSIK